MSERIILDILALIWPAMGITAVGIGTYFARRAVRAVERRSADTAEIDRLKERLVQLEETLDTVRGDMQRLEEGQDFTMNLLSSPSRSTPEQTGRLAGAPHSKSSTAS